VRWISDRLRASLRCDLVPGGRPGLRSMGNGPFSKQAFLPGFSKTASDCDQEKDRCLPLGHFRTLSPETLRS
jgi:hypothetical protein